MHHKFRIPCLIGYRIPLCSSTLLLQIINRSCYHHILSPAVLPVSIRTVVYFLLCYGSFC
uniref:Uncharacterized protein n=1 Tax=Arundo donax TaxID=35708 RepID=A0A0A9HFE7_ARUDO